MDAVWSNVRNSHFFCSMVNALNLTKFMVSVFVRLTTAEKIVFEVDLLSTVKTLKDLISQKQSVDSDLITLVFKGRILKDDVILKDCGLFVSFV